MEKLEGSNWENKDRTSKQYQASDKRAITKAIDLTVRAHSHALPEAGPEFFMKGLPKVMTIFKRFAQQQIYLVSKMFMQLYPRSADMAGMTKEQKKDYRDERRLAAGRLIGIYAASIMLAGIQGAPLYGAASMLAELIMDDEDEPFDTDTWVAQQVGNTMYGGPVNKMLGIDMSRRTGFRDMVFREDPQRLEQIGAFLYTLETLGGPSVSIGVRGGQGLTELFGDEGFNLRSAEKLLPTALGNTLKSYRQATEGVINKRGVRITDDPTTWQTVMQIGGFTNYEVSLAYRRANSLKGPERKLYKRRSRLLLEYWLAMQNGDTKGLQKTREEITQYNSKVPPSFIISPKTIQRSMKNRKKIEMRAIDGVDVRHRHELDLKYGIND